MPARKVGRSARMSNAPGRTSVKKQPRTSDIISKIDREKFIDAIHSAKLRYETEPDGQFDLTTFFPVI